MTNDELIQLMQDHMKEHGLQKVELARKINTPPINISRWIHQRHKISKAWGEIIKQKLTV